MYIEKLILYPYMSLVKVKGWDVDVDVKWDNV